MDRELIQEAFEETGEVPEEEQIARWMEKRNFHPEEADLKEKQRMYAFLARKGFRAENIPESNEVGICINLMKSRNKRREFLSLIPAFIFHLLDRYIKAV